MAMAYATLANRGISYYPRLVKKVLNQDGTPVLDEDGKIAVPDQPKVHADFRTEVSPADIELERHGFWNVVNADGGTGGRARLDGVQVAGKTGTAQAKYKGGEDTISWFICWAPFDNPKYTDRSHGAGRGTRRHRCVPDRRANHGTLAGDGRGEVRSAGRVASSRA